MVMGDISRKSRHIIPTLDVYGTNLSQLLPYRRPLGQHSSEIDQNLLAPWVDESPPSLLAIIPLSKQTIRFLLPCNHEKAMQRAVPNPKQKPISTQAKTDHQNDETVQIRDTAEPPESESASSADTSYVAELVEFSSAEAPLQATESPPDA